VRRGLKLLLSLDPRVSRQWWRVFRRRMRGQKGKAGRVLDFPEAWLWIVFVECGAEEVFC